MQSDSLCWVCSQPLERTDRVTRLASLGFEVHARCANAVLYDEVPRPQDSDEDDDV